MGFPRQEYWTGLSFLSAGDLPHPGMEPMFPALAGGIYIKISMAIFAVIENKNHAKVHRESQVK